MPLLRTLTTSVFILSLLFSADTFAQNYEKPVKMKDLPRAVRKTAQEQSKGAAIRGLSKEVEGGKTFYEVELRINGHNKDVLIDPTGAVVTIEEEIPIASLPPAVKVGIEKQAGDGEIVMVESITENDAVVAYEAHIKIGKRSLEVKVGPDGQLIATEDGGEDEAKERTGVKKSSQKTKKP